MTPRTGRPTDNPKKRVFQIRLTEEEAAKLEFCREQTGKTKTEIICKGIEHQYNELLSGNKQS